MWRPCGTFDDTYQNDMAIIRTRAQAGLVVSSLVVLSLLPLIVTGATITTVNLIALSIISVQGLNILTGLTGQISLGQGAFMAVGAYTLVILMNHLDFSYWLALPFGVTSAGLVGLVFGLPSLRIKGFYLAMATLAAQFLIPWMIVNVRPDLTGGTDTVNIPTPSLFGIVLSNQASIYYVIIFFSVMSIFLTRNLARSKLGRALIAIRDNDLAAEIMGVEIFRYKMISFFISSLYAGLAGCMWALWMGAVNVDAFGLEVSIWYLGMTIVGGLGSTLGAALGVIFIRLLDLAVLPVGATIAALFPPLIENAIKNGMGSLIFGLVLMLFIIYEPRGLAHLWEIMKHSYRRWPFPY